MHRSLIAAALLLMAPLATAQVYKWTDASGTVHYSQAPPSKGTRFKMVTTTGTAAPRVTLPPAASSKEGGDAAPKHAASKPVADTPENRSRLCVSLTNNIAVLQGSGPVVMQQGDKATALDADQRKQQLATDQSRYDQYCKGQ